MKFKIFILIALTLAIVSIILMIFTVMQGQSSVYIPTSSLDNHLGGDWTVVAQAKVYNYNGLSPILKTLASHAQAFYYSSYRSSDSNLSVFLFKYDSDNLSNIVTTIMGIYKDLDFNVTKLNNTGFYVSSNDTVSLYSTYKDYIIVIYISGNQSKESIEILSLQERTLG
ncbi:MAG: hypothetical protein QXR57_08515 [Metallosphaera sp.]